MKGVNFTSTELNSSVFSDSNLEDAIFSQTNLSGADLISALNFTIDPEQNKLKKASFSVHSLIGLLGKYRIKVVHQ